MTRRASEAAESVPSIPLLKERENAQTVGLLLVTGDRGLAGGFNSQIIRAGNAPRARAAGRGQGGQVVRLRASRGVSSLSFRGYDVTGFEGFTDRPAFSDAREIGDAVTTAYVDGDVDRVEVIYNHFVSTMTQEVSHETLLPLQQADVLGDDEDDEDSGDDDDGGGEAEESANIDQTRSLWIYEPSAEEILERLVPDYVEISIFRALLESTASEHGARMTAMRSASENAAEHHRRPHARGQPPAPGGHHAGNHGSRRWGRGPPLTEAWN